MADLFFIGDTHFGHENILSFEIDGKPLRPFKSLTEMHLTMVENWNRVVSPRRPEPRLHLSGRGDQLDEASIEP